MALRSAKPVDPELDQLAAELGARLAVIAATTRALADSHAEAHELAAGAAYDELLRLTLSTDALLATGDRRCPAPPAGTPQLAPSVIQGIVRGQSRQLQGCYEDGLQRDRALRGRIEVRFVIGRDGHVDSVTLPEAQIDPLAWPVEAPAVESLPSLLDVVVRRCVADEVSKLVFPSPRSEPITVTYPIVFAPWP